MSVNSINGFNALSTAGLQAAQSAPHAENSDNRSKEKRADNKALLLGSLAALAVGVGIYIATKGKKGGSTNTSAVTNTGVSGVPSVPAVPTGSAGTPKVPFFEKLGLKAEKGKVFNSDGTGYSGMVKTELNKNGERFEIEYKDGLIQKSTKFKGDEKISSKGWEYDTDGRLENIVAYDKDNRRLYNILEFYDYNGSRVYQIPSTGYEVCRMGHDKSIFGIAYNNYSKVFFDKYYRNGKLIGETMPDLSFVVYNPDGKKYLEYHFDHMSHSKIFIFDEKENCIKTIDKNICGDEFNKFRDIIKKIRGS